MWDSVNANPLGFLSTTCERPAASAGVVGLGLHVGAQDGVDAGLVAFAVLFEPLHDVVVHADGEAVLFF